MNSVVQSQQLHPESEIKGFIEQTNWARNATYILIWGVLYL